MSNSDFQVCLVGQVGLIEGLEVEIKRLKLCVKAAFLEGFDKGGEFCWDISVAGEDAYEGSQAEIAVAESL